MMTTTSTRQEQRALKAKKKEDKRATKEEAKRSMRMEEDDLQDNEEDDAQGDDIDTETLSSPTSAPSSSSSSHITISAASLADSIHHPTSDAMDASSSSSSSAFASAASAIAAMPAVSASATSSVAYLKVPVPPHRYTPLRQHWLELYQPIVEHMKLQIRFNTKRRAVELRTSKSTVEGSALNKAADFIRAFLLGFEIKDAIALLRLDDLYIDTFEIKDVKTLNGEHLSRAIGRIAGIGGKTKFTIENATKTRIVLADTHIHILGSFENINQAKTAVVRLILGSPPGKVYTAMRAIANRAKERF